MLDLFVVLLGCTDIECVKATGQGFPEAQEDPVIQISSIVAEQRREQTHKEKAAGAGAAGGAAATGRAAEASTGDATEQPVCRVIFALNECAPIAGAWVFWFEDEAEMLIKWAEFVREVKTSERTFPYSLLNSSLSSITSRLYPLSFIIGLHESCLV